MLTTLRRIVQELNAAHHLDEALQILVKRVRKAIATEACTVFLIDEKRQEYVLLATDGLNPQAIGKVRLKFNEGLVGLVGQREEPLNIEDAPSHPHYFYSSAVHEEAFKAFLGVPIIYHRRRLGVLIVQQTEKRRFDESEEAFLVTVSAQLGGIIAHAKITGMINRLLNPQLYQKENIVFSGVGATCGIGIGTAVVIYPLADLNAVPIRKTRRIKAESKAFAKALSATRKDIRRLTKHFANLSVEESELFDAYLKILDSTSLKNEVLKEIHQGLCAQSALRKIIEHHMHQFAEMDDEYLRERAADLRDLGRRILMHLQTEQYVPSSFPKKTILVGNEIYPSTLAEVPANQLVGVISQEGSRHSHAAILTRALGIPCVMGIENLPITQLEGQELIVDGFEGKVYVAPSPQQRKKFRSLLVHQREFIASLEELRGLPAQTKDGHSIALWVNTGFEIDAPTSLTVGAEGVGLYRTETPFMRRDRFPTEDEQHTIYRELLKSFAPHPVIMRTLDVGGDKILSYFPVEEDNPFLGWRGIRITLDHPEIFLVQIRAMLRANLHLENLRIMLPMISNTQEADEALRLIHQAHSELQNENPAIQMPPIGIMIEVPSAIYQAKFLAQRVDFLSVGSNDLTQYLLAVDRNNSRVANLYDHLHPAVLQALADVTNAAHKAGKPISICGEMASDPLAIPLLLAMGFSALSMNSIALLRTKWVIRNITLDKKPHLLKKVLAMDNAQQVRNYLQKTLKDFGLGRLV